MDLMKGVAGIFGSVQGFAKMDPITKLVDTFCDTAGLDPTTAGLVKLGVAAATGNVMIAADGIADLSSGLAYDSACTTEYASGSKQTKQSTQSGCSGYAPSTCNDPYVLGGMRLHAMLMKLLGLGEAPPPSKTQAANGDWENPNSPLASDFGEYRDALRVLKANYPTFDTAVGLPDGYLTRENLAAIVKNPHAAPELKQAAQFFLDHPEYYNRLEMSAGWAIKDGIVGMADVDKELARVEQDIRRYGLPPSNKTSGPSQAPQGTGPSQAPQGTGPSQAPQGTGPAKQQQAPDQVGELSAILRDPTLSLEEKIMLLLQRILEKLDDKIHDTMGQLAANEDEKYANGKRTDDNKADKEHKLNKTSNQLQQELQSLMEKRKQMFELMSNMSNKFHEMSKTAIQNLGRA
jgi:hypothetical protein